MDGKRIPKKPGEMLDVESVLRRYREQMQQNGGYDFDPAITPAEPVAPQTAPTQTAPWPRKQLLTPIDDLVQRVWSQSKHCGWGFGSKDFRTAEATVPTLPADESVMLALVPYLENETRTRVELLKFISSRILGFRVSPELGKQYAKIADANGRRHVRGLRWERIAVGINRGRSPDDVQNHGALPGAGMLAAIAEHSRWAEAMNGLDVPYAWLGGYAVDLFGSASKFGFAPVVDIDPLSGGVRLYARRKSDPVDSTIALPIFA